MSRARYSVAHKIEAVRRVTEDGHSVSDIAREMGVGRGSLFFWVRRHRQFAAAARERALRPEFRPAPPDPAPERSDSARGDGGAQSATRAPGSLVASLRRANIG